MEELKNYWFSNPDIWFGCGPEIDKEITERFGYLLSQNYDHEPNNLNHIILWDQIARHVYRNNSEKIKLYHEKSLVLSLELLERGYDKDLKPFERWFLLMPLRHTFEKCYLEIVIETTKGYINEDGFEHYRRFYRATLLSYSKIITRDLDIETINSTDDSNIVDILDKRSVNPLVDFLALRTFNLPHPEVFKHKIYKEFKKFIKTSKKSEGITISISGGVDSMICSYILSNLRFKFPDLKIVAVMVNYNNRPECILETQLVTRWLECLNIPLYVRHIKYLKRKDETDPTDRDFYEKVTKEFRFDLYRRFNYPVVLGHNKDDCIENIFTNIRKGRNYDNLNGMAQVTQVNDIVFYRPVLNITKSEIYEFAKVFKIPYLTDSTPTWSDRGKMRDSLIPFLNSFDPALIPGLIKLTESISELYKSQDLLFEQFKQRIIFKTNEAIILLNNNNIRSLGFEFWKQVVRYVTDRLGVSMCTNRSIQTLIKHLKYPKNGKTILSKYLEVRHNYNTLKICIK